MPDLTHHICAMAVQERDEDKPTGEMWSTSLDAFVSLAAMYYSGWTQDMEDRFIHMCKELQ